MYKHIVVAVDGSRTSLNALQHASSLAVAGNARLTLYMTLAPEFLQHDSYEAAAVAGGNEVLAEAREAAKNAGVADVQAHLLVSSKGAKEMAQGLVDYADSHGADLIVIGTHGRTGLMHLLMGSFAETVMRQSHLPLLVIRSVYSEDADESENDREEFSSSAM